MTYFNEFGQARLGWNVGVPSGSITPSTLWNSIYSVYNADSTGSSSLKTSLVAAYNGESNANDSFGSNNGTAVGGLTYTTGKIGNAFNFNGTNAYVTLPSDTLTPTGDFSISLWFNTNSASTERHIISNVHKQGGAAGQWKGWDIFTYNSKVYFRLWNTNVNSDVISTTTIANSTWYNVTVTKSGTTQRIYINGILEATNNSAVTPNYTSPNYPVIGAQFYHTSAGYEPSTLFNGRVDAISSWNKELTQSEITELYNSGNGAQYITDNFYKPTTNDALNTYNGTAQGGLTYGVGKVGTAFVFNGSNAYVDMGDVLDVGTSSWTYNFWVYPTNLSFSRTVFCKTTYGTPANSFDFYLESALMRFFIVLDSSNYISIRDNSTVLQGSTWQNITVVIDRTDKIKLYYNGVLSTNIVNFGNVNNNSLSSFSGTNIQSNFPFRIGASNSNTASLGQFFQGNIDSFNVWNRALTQSEITELYNSGNGKQYPN